MIYLRRVEGHSMEPGLQSGAVVVALRLPIRKNDLVIADVDHGEIIKRVAKLTPNKVYLAGKDNEHDYGWVPTTRILGRVIWHSKKRS